jgi:membrane-bound lytic murein transglycosylase D
VLKHLLTFLPVLAIGLPAAALPVAQPPVHAPTSSTVPDKADLADDDDEGAEPTEELKSAAEAEEKALKDDDALLSGRARLLAAPGSGSPLGYRLRDLPDLLPQADQDAREAQQIARELEQFETFDLGAASQRYDIPVELNDQVSQYIRVFQVPLRQHFVVWLSRVSRYGPWMRDALVREGVPADTVFLALIESGFNPLAYSRAAAAGQWQFISSTGRRFGLRTDFWVDERRDPEKSTLAAARYLKELRGQLGSWYLAWAGYNAGAGRVATAIRHHHSTDFWELIHGRELRKETKGYVPKLIAAALIAKHPRAFGFDDVAWQRPIDHEQLSVAEPTELSFIASAAGTDVTTLHDLNPALRRFCTPPTADGSPYVINVPVGTADRVAHALAQRPKADQLAFRYHKVQPGEGLGAVAHKMGVDPEVIARMNGIHAGQALRPGRELVIPMKGEGDPEERVASVGDERDVFRPHRGRRHGRRINMGWRASDDCQEPFSGSTGGGGLVLAPEPVESRTVESRTAVVSPPRPVATEIKASAEADMEERPADASVYVVAEGDSLWSISQRTGQTLAQLCDWNGFAHRRRVKLMPGQKLWVRGEVGGAVSSQSSEPPQPAKASATDQPAETSVAATTYTLRDGDNLWAVAQRFHVKIADLARWNAIDPDDILHPGQELKVSSSQGQ